MGAPSARTFSLAACWQRLPPQHPYFTKQLTHIVFQNNAMSSEYQRDPDVQSAKLDQLLTTAEPFDSSLLRLITPRQQQPPAVSLFTHIQAHKAGVPCRSLIILCSWLSPTEDLSAMAPLLCRCLSLAAMGEVTGSHQACWIRESEIHWNKWLTWMF